MAELIKGLLFGIRKDFLGRERGPGRKSS